MEKRKSNLQRMNGRDMYSAEFQIAYTEHWDLHHARVCCSEEAVKSAAGSGMNQTCVMMILILWTSCQ
jgi:hypothetical protein